MMTSPTIIAFSATSSMKAHRQKMAPEHDKDENENAKAAADTENG